MSRFYALITSTQDLKALHDEAVAHGKLEVGLSKGKILYAWDDERNNVRSLTIDEAARRLGLTTDQVAKIIETNAEVVFPEEETPADLMPETPDLIFQEASLPENEPQEPETQEEAPVVGDLGHDVADPDDEESTEENVDAPEHILDTSVKSENEDKAPVKIITEGSDDELRKALVRLADKVIEALKGFVIEISKTSKDE